jgi:hypothetical protein
MRLTATVEGVVKGCISWNGMKTEQLAVGFGSASLLFRVQLRNPSTQQSQESCLPYPVPV